ncbi:MAG: hypothetical protein GY844_11185 [Bradyrhizobium sp.]|nr:hypothetical protein [Bradyrhizobium sp.]
MCCHIPPYLDDPIRPDRLADGNDLVGQKWMSLFGGVAFLSLSLASAIWLAVRLG